MRRCCAYLRSRTGCYGALSPDTVLPASWAAVLAGPAPCAGGLPALGRAMATPRHEQSADLSNAARPAGALGAAPEAATARGLGVAHRRALRRTVADALMGVAAGDKPLGPSKAPARAPCATGKRVRKPRLLPPGVTALPGASSGERGGEVLYSPAAFAPAEAQRLLERLQARPTAPGQRSACLAACLLWIIKGVAQQVQT